MIPLMWLEIMPAQIGIYFDYLFPFVLFAFLLLFTLDYHANSTLPRNWDQIQSALRPLQVPAVLARRGFGGNFQTKAFFLILKKFIIL
jgi:hypothetical protein